MRIGSTVDYFPGSYDRTQMAALADRLAAVVTHVHESGQVNLVVFDSMANVWPRTRVGVDAPGQAAEGYASEVAAE